MEHLVVCGLGNRLYSKAQKLSHWKARATYIYGSGIHTLAILQYNKTSY